MTGRGLKVARRVVEKETDRTRERERERERSKGSDLPQIARCSGSIEHWAIVCMLQRHVQPKESLAESPKVHQWKSLLAVESLRGRRTETRLSFCFTLLEYSPACGENSAQSSGERVFVAGDENSVLI